MGAFLQLMAAGSKYVGLCAHMSHEGIYYYMKFVLRSCEMFTFWDVSYEKTKNKTKKQKMERNSRELAVLTGNHL